MTDPLIERVARAICDDRSWDFDDGYWQAMSLKDAQAALAALKPGDELGEGRLVMRIDEFVAAQQRAARQAAEAKREKIIALIHKNGWEEADMLEDLIRAQEADDG